MNLTWLDPDPEIHVFRLAAAVLAQVTVVVLLAWGLASLPSRRSAAARHAIWLVALFGVLVGPVLTLGLDGAGWTIRVVDDSEPLAPGAAASRLELEGHGRAAQESAGTAGRFPGKIRTDPEHPATAVPLTLGAAQPSTAATAEAPTGTPFGRRAAWVALVVWMIGAGLLLGRLAYAVVVLERLRGRSRPLAGGRVEGLMAEVAGALGMRAAPRVRTSERLAGPVACGVARPLILLPEDFAHRADDSQLRDVLIHEAAHLARLDPLFGLLQRLAGAIFWPHPLMVLLNRELTRAREEVCDNHVLRLGDRARYARLLLDLAESFRASASPPALTAAGLLPARWRLADRVAGLLDERRDLMVRVDRRVSGGLIALTLLAVAPLAVLGTARREAQARPATPTAAQAEPAPTVLAVDESPITEEEIAGVVTDFNGRPLEGVTVDAYSWYPGHETTTDAEGRFRLRAFTGPGYDPKEGAQVRFTREGYGPKTFESIQGGTADLGIVMDDSTWFEGTVTAPDGTPVPDATIRASNPMLRDGREVGQLWTETRTDAEGRYRLHVEPAVFDISVRVPGVGVARHERQTIQPGHSNDLDIRLEEGIDFRAKVVDSLTGEPVEGLRLFRWLRLNDADIDGRSGPDGIVNLDDLTPGDISFQVEVPGYARWWSEEAQSAWNRKTIGRDDERYGPWQRNFDGLDFQLMPGMEPVTIVAEKGVTVRGRVLDPEGNPVAGATVAPALTGSGNSLTGDTRFSVTTEEDGTYEVLLPASGARDYNLIAHDGEYLEWRTWANSVTEPFRTQPGQVIEDFDIALTHPATVRGRVLDATGNPVADSEVRATGLDMKDNRYYVPTTRTGADGRFELTHIRPGEQFIQAAPFFLFADQAPPGTSRIITLEPGQVVEKIELNAQPLR